MVEVVVVTGILIWEHTDGLSLEVSWIECLCEIECGFQFVIDEFFHRN